MDDDQSVDRSAADELAKHERTIQAGLQTFVDVGLALLAIKAGKLYEAAGFATFDAYCSQRWGLEHSRRQQLMMAATIATDVLGDSTAVEVAPTYERQVRPLAKLETDEDKRAAWDEAVERAGGQPPTGRLVEAVVQERLDEPPQPPTGPRGWHHRKRHLDPARIVRESVAALQGISMGLALITPEDVSDELAMLWTRADTALHLQRVLFMERRALAAHHEAIRDAIADGCSVEDIAQAAQLDPADVLAVLEASQP